MANRNKELSKKKGKQMIEGIKFMVLTAIFIRAVYTDIKSGKIENGLIGTGLIAGLLTAYFGSGMEGVWKGIQMSILCLALLFILFILKGLGGGDIKLFCVIALFLPEQIMGIVITSFFAGAVVALGKMFIRRLQKKTVFIWHEKISFSIPMAIGTGFSVVSSYLR